MLTHVREGGHTWGLHMAPNNLAPLSHTILGAHASFHVIPMLQRSSSGETLDRGPRIVYPYSYLRTRVSRWTSLLVFVSLGHMYMESQGWANFATFSAPVVTRRDFPRTDPGFY